ncbi:hypothetical protein ABKV83_11800 [Enterobacter asburiae]|uniref:hypothetical protein n=1 Tax=Enterobacter cloacae complex TaxID=354276 RepID=UPI00207630C9|nr:hypothetical protein [Enterobacter kobei]MCM7502441.1 hypothetical protein [Enterobacter kobei]HDT1287370.1 hypothetical protein [Enterobacter asburiae]
MKEFKGTPGKWIFSHSSASDDNVACIEINSSESMYEIAYLQSTPTNIGKYENTSFDKTIANAHLIAAAPDLLEALLSIVNMEYQPKDDESDKVYLKARAAISKALGEE